LAREQDVGRLFEAVSIMNSSRIKKLIVSVVAESDIRDELSDVLLAGSR